MVTLLPGKGGPLLLGLTTVFALVLGSVPPLAAAPSVCLRCHPKHYELQGTCPSCHRGDDRAARKELAHHNLIPGPLASYRFETSPARERGAKLVEILACLRCHRLNQRGNGLASDLDQVAATKSVARLRTALATPAWYMPDFRLAAPATNDLLTYLLAMGAQDTKQRSRVEIPERVHFAVRQTGKLVDPFNRVCGGCHLTMTARDGGLGRGKVAPNLAGLLGEFYPHSYGQGERWTEGNLKTWLENPRARRPLTIMPPVRLSPRDYGLLLEQLSGKRKE